MNYLPLDLPPGIRRAGTEYQSRFRWYDTNLVRWYDGALGPVLGWLQRTASAVSGKARAILAWRDNSGDRRVAIGTHAKLYSMNESGTLSDITPAGFTAGRADASANIGYGGQGYGTGNYGVPRPDGGSLLDATVWDLDSFGQYLVGCSPDDGTLYEWQLNTGVLPAPIANAPTGCKGIVVTPERAVMALGAGSNARKFQWSDLEVNTVWTPSSTNQAGDGEVQQGRLVLGRVVGSVTLLLSDIEAYAVHYVGLPFVYAARKVGDDCGAISKRCIAVVGQSAAWWSASGFWLFDGAVRPLDCAIWDDIQRSFAQSQKSKVTAFHNERYAEVWWFYPSGASIENDRYALWNYKENWWANGSLARLCGVEGGVFHYPLLMGADGFLYEHETGYAYGGAVPSARSGPIELGSGDSIAYVLGIVPDEKTAGEVSVSFRTRSFPNAEEIVLDAVALTSAGRADLRFCGRQVELVVSGTVNTNWRWGVPRLEVKSGGRR